MRRNFVPAVAILGILALQTAPGLAPAQSPDGMRQAEGTRARLATPVAVESQGPVATAAPIKSLGPVAAPAPVKSQGPTGPQAAKPDEIDRSLRINLATALRLADARPLVIEAARAAVETELGLYEQARVLWLPTVDVGVDYQRHDGSQLNILNGAQITGPFNQFVAGAGAQAVFALTDAIYAPLAERQLLRARNLDVQTAKNDALLAVAVAYFDVQQARGILAGTLDAVARSRELERRITVLGKGLAPLIEVERVRATREDLEQQAASARQDWRFNSASLTRVLRLDPAVVAVPLEPAELQITLISPQESVDTLIPVGLTSRPELESQQAVVQATLVRLRQERMRPLIPSLVLQSNSVPNENLGGGVYGTGTNSLNSWSGRSDWNAEVVWELKNLGFGNAGLVTQRLGEQRQALAELFRIQDLVAAEVTQAHAQVEAAAVRMARAEAGLKAAILSYEGNLKGMGETVRAGELLQLVNRPQEVVAALMQLQQAYINYYTSTNDYNRAQFRLFRAVGYAAQSLACSDSFGPVIPVDPSRPPQMAPVPALEPCSGCPR